MRTRELGLAVILATACSTTNPPLTDTTSAGSAGTTGSGATTGGVSSAAASTSTSATSTATTTATTTSTTTSTSTSTSTTTSTVSSTGATATSGTTTAAASTSGTSGTTGTSGLGYQPYDAGPATFPIPSPDSGCPIYDAVFTDAGGCVQCLGDSDCPAPLVCDLSGRFNTGACVACDAAHPVCDPGQVCQLGGFPGDLCLPDCRLDAGQCGANASLFGAYCDFDSGFCLTGCFDNGDCPASNPVCLIDLSEGPGPESCAPCSPEFGANLPNDGCAAGDLCQADTQTSGNCAFDCRADAGACVPGICDLTGLSGAQFMCWPDVCRSDADCAAGSARVCYIPDGGAAGDAGLGECTGCLQDSDCVAHGIGMPVCQNAGFGGGICTAVCGNTTQALVSCGGQPCLPFQSFPGSEGFKGYDCGCETDADCAGQANTPSCIPVSDAGGAGIDAGAGLYGVCGCTPNSCGAGSVCETRTLELTQALTQAPPFGACIPSCAGSGAGAFDCAANGDGFCNTSTGYCASCTDDSQCEAPRPNCLPSDDVPGDGVCGCQSPAACSDGLTCDHPGQPGSSCGAPCVRTDTGFDSCLYDVGGTAYTGRCNTESGECQQCLSNPDCAGRASWAGVANSVPLALCSAAGVCEQCFSSADCPAAAPGCLGGACGACATSADCPAAAPECIAAITEYGGDSLCVPPCTVDGGECDNGGPTPICNSAFGYCVQCATADDCSPALGGQNCVSGFCLWPN